MLERHHQIEEIDVASVLGQSTLHCDDVGLILVLFRLFEEDIREELFQVNRIMLLEFGCLLLWNALGFVEICLEILPDRRDRVMVDISVDIE